MEGNAERQQYEPVRGGSIDQSDLKGWCGRNGMDLMIITPCLKPDY